MNRLDPHADNDHAERRIKDRSSEERVMPADDKAEKVFRDFEETVLDQHHNTFPLRKRDYSLRTARLICWLTIPSSMTRSC